MCQRRRVGEECPEIQEGIAKTPLSGYLLGVPDQTSLPYQSYSAYLKKRYGTAAYRVAVDAGFTCPNRAGGRSGEGCSYCEISGARAVYLDQTGPEEMKKQVARGVKFLTKRYDARILLLYFQAYTNTFGSVDELRSLYNGCLELAPFRELIVSTRPDEIDLPRADLLASYRTENFDVWVELGLQSVHDQTLKRVNRGHDSAAFFCAFELLRERNIKTAVHLIFGLPGEGRREIMESVRRVAALRPEGIKLHNLHIPVSSPLYREYLKGSVTVPSAARHAEYVAEALTLLPPETIIMRMTCDTPSARRAAPLWVPRKSAFSNEVVRLMNEKKERQGDRFPAAG